MLLCFYLKCKASIHFQPNKFKFQNIKPPLYVTTICSEDKKLANDNILKINSDNKVIVILLSRRKTAVTAAAESVGLSGVPNMVFISTVQRRLTPFCHVLTSVP